MDLSSEQKTALSEWVGQGMGLPEIQRKLAADFGINLTFMDVRFLIDDLDLDIKDQPGRAEETDISKAAPVASIPPRTVSAARVVTPQ